MKSIKESQASKQAKEVFNNTYEQIVEHFEEEAKELVIELKRKPQHIINTLDEMADVAYMLNQLCDFHGVEYDRLLAHAINKNERKRK